jgi:hypothetical protein
MKKIVLILVVSLAAFLGYVSTRSSQFHFERSGLINAPAAKIYPYISSFKQCQLWNPYDQKDPAMKRVYKGEDGKLGSIMEFSGNKEVGEGSLEFARMVPNEVVELKLVMTKPMHAENRIHYILKPEGSATRFTWGMDGDSGFAGKLISVFINCEKMVSGDLEKGVAQLKSLVETAH